MPYHVVRLREFTVALPRELALMLADQSITQTLPAERTYWGDTRRVCRSFVDGADLNISVGAEAIGPNPEHELWSTLTVYATFSGGGVARWGHHERKHAERLVQDLVDALEGSLQRYVLEGSLMEWRAGLD